MWRYGVAVISAVQLHAIKRELKFCADSISSCGISEIHNDDGDLLWWPWLVIRLNTFHQSSIMPKQFIIHYHKCSKYCRAGINSSSKDLYLLRKTWRQNVSVLIEWDKSKMWSWRVCNTFSASLSIIWVFSYLPKFCSKIPKIRKSCLKFLKTS